MEEEAIKISSFRAAMAIEDPVLLNTVKEFSERIYYINIHYLQEIAGYSSCKLYRSPPIFTVVFKAE